MNHWPFIIAAYVITGIGTLAVTGWAWAAMRAAERDSDSLGRDG
jgi:hypothetical protein